MAKPTSELVDRLRMRLDREAGMQSLDEVVLKYGIVEGAPFSFKDHEYQREILQDSALRIAVRKCSQVGMSELSVQKALAMTASLQHMRLIYTLPTKEFAMRFSKDRFDQAIDNSEFYSGMVEAASNSAGQKKIGSCMLYITGTFGANSAISVPAEGVISDEVDFSNQVVLGKMNSRLRHAKVTDEYGNRGIRHSFSTPTVGGYGIDLEYQQGTQKQYACRCEHCSKWVVPEYLRDFDIPGWKRDIAEFSREDSYDYDLTKARILCPNCRKDLLSSLCRAENRKWIALFPDRPSQSYQVNPWDVPKYNTPYAIIKQIQDYPLKSDFFNFVLGLPYTDAENTFTTSEAFRLEVAVLDAIRFEGSLVTRGTVMGMDVGKVCHLVVGIPMGRQLHVVWAEKIRNDRFDPALPKVLARYDYFKCVSMVVDSGPDITLVNGLTEARSEIRAAVYVRSIQGVKVQQEHQSEPTVNVDRTGSLTLLLKRHNSGDILYPKGDLSQQIFKHLQTTKKIRKQNPDGSFSEMFVKTSDEDHWVHALHYTQVAAELKFGVGNDSGIAAPVAVGRVKVGGAATENEDKIKEALKRRFVW